MFVPNFLILNNFIMKKDRVYLEVLTNETTVGFVRNGTCTRAPLRISDDNITFTRITIGRGRLGRPLITIVLVR